MPIKIKSIKYIGKVEQQCIEVKAKDGLYLTEDNIVTHNSALAMQNGVNYKIINGAGSILGQNIISAVISELTMFSENGWSDDKIFTFFTKLRKRIDNRMKGNYYGRFIIDSQPNSLESPIDEWIWDSGTKKNKKNYIVTGSRWKYFPKEFPTAWETPRTDWKQPINLKKDFVHAFPVFKGGDGQPPKVIETESELTAYNPQDIEWAPMNQITSNGVVSFKDNAEESPINFLRDQAGIPSGAADRLIYNKEWIDHAFDNNLKNIYSTIIAKTEDEPEHLIWNQVKDKFFNKILGKYYFYYEPSLPRAASIDLAISGDTAGIAISHVERDKVRLDTQGQPLKVYVTDMVVPVIPKGGMINLDAFKFFILDLIRLGNMNIRHVSFDSFQSRAMINRMNMDKDKKREVTRVNSGIILSGQEMATADIALFSRFIFLRYDKSEFTPQAKMQFQQLKELRKMGCTHLTMDILRHRTLVEAEYAHSYQKVQSDLRAALENSGIEDRIANNWAAAVAAFHCLQSRLDLPFTYDELLAIAVDGIIEQNKETKRNSEVSTLWDIINFLRTEGHLVMQADFRIETINRLKVDNSATPIEFAQPKKILYLRYKRVFELYQMHSKKIGESLLSKSSLPFYMEHSPAYLGKKRSFRFKNIIQGYAQSSIPDGQTAFSSESVLDQAYCFDYDMIVELYGVNLDIVYGLGNEDEEK